MSIAVTKANFEQEVLQSDLPVLVDFWAYWCGPCMAQTPILNEIIMERPNLMKICKVNIDEEFQLVDDYQVFSIPTLLFFRNGKLLKKLVGVQTKETILGLLKLPDAE